jgi:hypothetical protein
LWTNIQERGMKTGPKMLAAALGAAAAILTLGEICAQAAQRRTAHQFPRRHSTAARDRAAFHHSGTRGRMGLGASPHRPEGPGNATFSR